jgi:hypothetical protein
MNEHRPIILVLLAVALVWSMQLAGIFGIFFLAVLGATITEGLRRGSLPLAPAHYSVRRASEVLADLECVCRNHLGEHRGLTAAALMSAFHPYRTPAD